MKIYVTDEENEHYEIMAMVGFNQNSSELFSTECSSLEIKTTMRKVINFINDRKEGGVFAVNTIINKKISKSVFYRINPESPSEFIIKGKDKKLFQRLFNSTVICNNLKQHITKQ